jgi:carboxymethylenebutenolidase
MADIQPEGHLALPKAGSGPGVLVLHAWWGLNAAFKDFSDRLAEEGFVAFAPDLFHGQIATTVEEAERLSSAADAEFERVRADVRNAIVYLRSLKAATGQSIGIVAFSFGAYYAVDASIDRPEDVGAVILFYGSGEGDFTQARAAYLAHFAENDEWATAEEVAQFEANLHAAGRPATFYTYPGTSHWFFEADRPDAFNEEAAALAWERTVSFLREKLARPG